MYGINDQDDEDDNYIDKGREEVEVEETYCENECYETQEVNEDSE